MYVSAWTGMCIHVYVCKRYYVYTRSDQKPILRDNSPELNISVTTPTWCHWSPVKRSLNIKKPHPCHVTPHVTMPPRLRESVWRAGGEPLHKNLRSWWSPPPPLSPPPFSLLSFSPTPYDSHSTTQEMFHPPRPPLTFHVAVGPTVNIPLRFSEW